MTFVKILGVLGLILIIFIVVVAFVLWRGSSIYFSNNTSGFELDSSKVSVSDHKINIKGIEVHYTTSGEYNTQTIVLLQGISGSFDRANAYNLRIHSVLSKNFKVYIPEHPNHRRSGLTNTIWSYSDYKEYLEEFISKLEIENPVIIGQSFGGKLAQVYAIEHSEEMELLVIGDASTSFNDRTFYEKVLSKFTPIGVSLMESNFVPNKLKHFLISFTFSIPEERIDTQNYAKYATSVRSLGTMGEDYSEKLSHITVPTVIIWGEKDMQFPPEQGEKLRDRLSNAELVVFEGASHTAMYEDPERTLSIILNKLSELN